MAFRIGNPAARFDYVLAADRSSGAPTVFVLRRLTWEQLAHVRDLAPFSSPAQVLDVMRITEAALKEGRAPNLEELAALDAAMPDWRSRGVQLQRMMARAVQAGVTEIRGLEDEKGAPLALAPAEFAASAPVEIVSELGGEILRISTLDEAEAKNSAAPPGPGPVAAPATPARGSRSTRRAAKRTTSPSAG